MFPKEILIVEKRGGGERAIPSGKWYIDRYTEVGEDADFYEVMPHEGRRFIPLCTIIRREKDSPKVSSAKQEGK